MARLALTLLGGRFVGTEISALSFNACGSDWRKSLNVLVQQPSAA
jgi:hypothetical protein